MSARSIGSPPVRMIVGRLKEATLSRSARHSARVSSPEYASCRAAARQCLQFRRHERVTSQAMSLGRGAPVAEGWVSAVIHAPISSSVK